ncbi:hypothetical protein [Modestobacter marinus]|uniref:hypothetical protein n=1 Tax=Modestobacter marinus TaxID=477641 RepID=UPI001C93C5A2|nr:hypothetical protein [Modestobacter marinus]
MLILTPTPLETAAERAFFAELADWDTGGGVRGAVMAARPAVEGPMHRRLSDAVLFVPEGLAVVRVVEVERQSGIVTATPDGAWTIGPGNAPGDVLQLSGGGSTPLDGLMRAGMEAAVTLRRAGLDPGRIARLAVLVGAVTGLNPPDGDLGEGDQVALLDPRSLLLGVARASRYAGTDNPRLWTTADVRAAIEALGVPGRTPTVEELNGEGFPYSPYVLRRPDLLTPATLNAKPTRVAAEPAPEVPDRVAPAGPIVDPAAAARVAAAAVAAQAEAEAEAAAAPAPAHEPAAQAAAAAVPPPSTGQDPVVAAAPAPPAVPPQTPRVPSTGVLPTQLQQARSGDTVALVSEPGGARPGEETGGIGGLFAAPAPQTAGSRQPPVPPPVQRELPPELRPRRRAPSGDDPDEQERPRRARSALLVAAAVTVVLVLLVVGVLTFTGRDNDTPADQAGATTAAPDTPAPAAGLTPGATEVVNGITFTLQVQQSDTSCRGHSYSSVAAFFGNSDCTALDRWLWSADPDGRPAVVSVARIEMPDAAGAGALRSLADTDGSGNVNDLLREGVSWDGGPDRLRNAEYASSQQGSTVTIVETSWTGEAGATSALDALASAALSLPPAA